MAVFLLTYDLNKEDGSAGYKKLWDELNRLKAHRVLESVWLLNVTNTAQQLADHFKGLVDSNDSLFIVSVRKGEHWFVNAKAGANDWLKNNPPA